MIRNCTVRLSLAAIIITLALVTGSGAATAAEQRWECCAATFLAKCSPSLHEIVITLTADRTNGTGTFTFDTVTQNTDYGTSGFTRIWRWKEAKTSLLELKIDGSAAYYNFANTKPDQEVRPSQYFTCQRR